MTSYIIKSVLCSGILLLSYHLFLQKEKMFRFNRFYLLVSIVFSLAVPLLSFEVKTDRLPESVSNSIPHAEIQQTISNSLVPTSLALKTGQKSMARYLPEILYVFISLLLFFRILKNVIAILIQRKNCRSIAFHTARLIMLPQEVVTYTFLNNIFVSESDYGQNRIEEEVLTHELAHVRQRHTFDILFIECVSAFFWINP